MASGDGLKNNSDIEAFHKLVIILKYHCSSKKRPPKKDKQIAGRRIYEALLLHSWRKLRIDVTVVTESLRPLEFQNRKLELQIEALHRLRLAESEKRNEATSQSQFLYLENNEIVRKNKTLLQEKCLLEEEIKNFKDKISEMQPQLEDVKAQSIVKHVALQNSEYQLVMERRKIKHLENEKTILKEQVRIFISIYFKKLQQLLQESSRKKDIQDYRHQIEILQEKFLNGELRLHDTLFLHNGLKEENQEILEKIKMGMFTNRKIIEENEKLKLSLFVIRGVLKKEKNRPWWKNVSDLGFAAVCFLKSAAYILLPLVSYTDTKLGD
ncbi:hypothetical protein FQA39_LY17700 [Lamprigera yunnana]|nr:hypothetical protein FQA39_LY17700 [Lamprigera yunnana]